MLSLATASCCSNIFRSRTRVAALSDVFGFQCIERIENKMNKFGNLLCVLILVCTSCGMAAAQAKPIGELRRMFDYDRRLPLDVKEIGVEARDGASVHDISYQSPKGGRVTAF